MCQVEPGQIKRSRSEGFVSKAGRLCKAPDRHAPRPWIGLELPDLVPATVWHKCCYTGDPWALDWGPSNHTQLAPSTFLMIPSKSSMRSA
jgi:hypothetical protein